MPYGKPGVKPEKVATTYGFDGHTSIQLHPIIVMDVAALYFHQELMGPGQGTHLPTSWTPLDDQWFCMPSVLHHIRATLVLIWHHALFVLDL